MTFLLWILGIGGVLWWLNLFSSSDNSPATSSQQSADKDTVDTTSLFSDQDGMDTSTSLFSDSISSSCMWCGSSCCSGGIDCMNSSNPLSGFHDDMFQHDTSSMFDDSFSSHSSFDD